jgi:hypothetical protein
MCFWSDLWEFRAEDLINSPSGAYIKIQQIIRKNERCYAKLDSNTGIELIKRLPLDDIEVLESFIEAAFKLI